VNLNTSLLQQRALFYSPLSFCRGYEAKLAASVLGDWESSIERGELSCRGEQVRLWFKQLDWDSQYFSCATFRIELIEWDAGIADPRQSVSDLLSDLWIELQQTYQRFYLLMDVPSEDTVVLQAAGMSGMRLVETRLTYYHNQLDQICAQDVLPVRQAVKEDIENLRQVARQARNDYDRFHADPFYSPETADEFLAEYVAQCVKGYTDVVLVPAVDSDPPGAFVCGTKDLSSVSELSAGRLVLVAVAEPRRGWYHNLNQALMLWMREQGMQMIVNTTQSTNRAVIHVCESLGYQYGRASHILALNRQGE